MALIKEMKKAVRNSRLHQEAESTYNIVVHEGRKYIQINTYGSKERVYTNSVSQSIQLDEQVAKKLLQIIKSEYGL